MDIVIIGEDDHYHHDDIEDDQDSDFISTEHVSLTKELQEKQSKAVEELEIILGEFELSDAVTDSYDRTDLLSVVRHLHRTLNNYKLRTSKSHHEEKEEGEDSERAEKAGMIDVDNISDELMQAALRTLKPAVGGAV